MTPPPTSPTRPSSDLQSHLYASFLQRKTADVALRISGSWQAIYQLHRVVLIQAGFFQSLFTSGFNESQSKLSSHRAAPDCIDIIFDDPNITRAAFELCIARLYGGGPPLWISPSSIPTPTHPLTPPFASTGQNALLSESNNLLPSSLEVSTASTLPSGHHSATPRFLLSLLATAVYLSIPSVASQALSAIVRTVGPHTAVRYLNFAVGRGIGPVYDLGTGNQGTDFDSEAATGLEDVAELVKDEEYSSTYESSEVPVDLMPQREDNRDASSSSSGTRERETSKHSHSVDGPPDSDTDSEADANAERDAGKTADSRVDPAASRTEPCYYYGAVSDKVGEAAACWLSRWGVDMLRLEQASLSELESDARSRGQHVIWSPVPRDVQYASERPGSAPPEMPGSRLGGPARSASGRPVVAPVVWRKGGLSARWVRGILSSDALFVRGEKERYEMARSVVEMRRASRTTGEPEESVEDEEAEFERLFNEGIYYANMNLDDLMAISRDISPSTGKAVVPLAVLQGALWNQSTLYHQITYRPPGSSSPTLSPSITKELGIGVTAEDIQKLAVHPEERSKEYYPIPGDASFRLGDSTGIEGASMDQLFEVGSAKRSGPHATEANFFGLERSYRLASSFLPSTDTSAPPAPEHDTKWTSHPPFRFAVEFWDVDALKEKSRLHSHTIWYAGSLYNVYVQVVRKKGVQLGIYLHRQSTVDPIPPSSAPIAAMGILAAPPRDRSMLGRGASTSVSGPRPPLSFGSSSAGASPSASASRASTGMSTLAQTLAITLAASAGPSAPSTPVSAGSSSLPGLAFSRTPTPTPTPTAFHASSGSVGSVAAPPSAAVMMALPMTAPPVTPAQPYRDPRPKVSAYFTIACASATGASVTRFASAPDTFAVSQSWGWKSSSLRTEEYLELDAEGLPRHVVMPAGREVSLRATVVLGVV